MWRALGMAVTRSKNKSVELPAASGAGKPASTTTTRVRTIATVKKVTTKNGANGAQPSKTTTTVKVTTTTKIKAPSDSKLLAPVSLPASFVAGHKPQFIEAINGILAVDPSLVDLVTSTPWGRYAIEEGAPDINSHTINESVPEDIGDLDPIAYHYWDALIRSIISQQVSGAAARSIRGKLYGFFDNAITPAKVLAADTEDLRGCGLSYSKVKYVKDVSEKFSDVECPLCNPQWYKTAPLEDIVTELTKIKGIGIWSAKMFAAFNLHEPDVFAEEDLGIARGMARYVQTRKELLQEAKENVEIKKRRKSTISGSGKRRDWTPIEEEYMRYIAKKFSPHQTIFQAIMWRLSDTNIDVLANNDEGELADSKPKSKSKAKSTTSKSKKTAKKESD